MVGISNTTFLWKGKDAQGFLVQGELSTVSAIHVKAYLKKRHISPIKISKKRTILSFFKPSIKLFDILAITRQWATMLKAGLPLLQVITITSQNVKNSHLKVVLDTIKSEITSGASLSEALQRFPKYFDSLYRNLILIGEETGTLDTMFHRINLYLENKEQLRQKIKKALIYPVIVIAFSLVITAILLIKVVPEFQKMFQAFNATLPIFTQWILLLSDYLQRGWFYFLLIALLFIIAIKVTFKMSKKVSLAFDHFLIELPFFGKMIRYALIARFSRTLATTFASGMPLESALSFLSVSERNTFYQQQISKLKNAVISGQPCYQAMQTITFFPPLVIQMIEAGETTGFLEEMLERIAIIYESDVAYSLGKMMTIIEPFIIAVLGLLVGGLVIAMYLPMFRLGSII